MPLPLLPSFLPLEIRSIIYVMVDELVLAKSHPEVFWALAPRHLRTLTIGRSLNFFINPKLLTQLADLYPSCGRYVRSLTLMTDIETIHIITRFLENFPTHRQLQTLKIEKALVKDSYYYVQSLPWLELINELVLSTPTLTRLTFSKVYPASSLIVCASALTRLDLGHFEPYITPHSIRLPITLEILSLSPCILNCITHPPPPGLRVLIIEADVLSDPPLVEELRLYATEAPILTKVALLDFCMFFFFFF